MPASIACAKAGVTTGEWGWTLREAFGEYRAPTGVGNAMRNDVGGLDDIRAEVDRVSRKLGRRLTFLVGKPGLDGHSNGAEQIAVRARDAGMQVIYAGHPAHAGGDRRGRARAEGARGRAVDPVGQPSAAGAGRGQPAEAGRHRRRAGGGRRHHPAGGRRGARSRPASPRSTRRRISSSTASCRTWCGSWKAAPTAADSAPSPQAMLRLSRRRGPSEPCRAREETSWLSKQSSSVLIVGAVAGWLAGLIVTRHRLRPDRQHRRRHRRRVHRRLAAAANRHRDRRRHDRGDHQRHHRRGDPAGDHRADQARLTRGRRRAAPRAAPRATRACADRRPCRPPARPLRRPASVRPDTPMIGMRAGRRPAARGCAASPRCRRCRAASRPSARRRARRAPPSRPRLRRCRRS